MTETNTIPNPPPMSHDDARKYVFGALRELERSLYNKGYDDGFSAGWDAAYRRFMTMLETPPQPEPQATPPQAPEPPTIVAEPQEPEQPAQDVVLSIIQGTPGLRGNAIVDMTSTYGTPLKERTVRTALHRLKLAGRIMNQDGRWYPAMTIPLDNKSSGTPSQSNAAALQTSTQGGGQ